MARFLVTEEPPRQRAHLVPLLGLIMGLALGALALDLLAGLPHLPPSTPTWAGVMSTLQGAELSLTLVSYVLSTVAWLLWIWIAFSLLLRLFVASLAAVAHGAAWLRRLEAVSDHITPAVVRHVVDGAMVAIFVVNLASQSPSAAAAPASQTHAPTTATLTAVIDSSSQSPESPDSQASATSDYVVQPGDTLWDIAERFYGNGDAYTRLVAANAGRLMPDGRRFTQAGVIYPGWVLIVPPMTSPAEQAGRVYVVQPGDTLRSIAAQLLGNELRWPEIFSLNHGTAALSNGRTLTDPDIIWPGMTLKIPQRSVSPRTDTATSPFAPPHVSGPSKSLKNAVPPLPDKADMAASGEGPTEIDPTKGRAGKVTSSLPTSTPPTPSQPAVASGPPAKTSSTPNDNVDAPLIYGGVGLAIAALTGGGLVLGQRMRRHLDEPPIRLLRTRLRHEDDFVARGTDGSSGDDGDLGSTAAEYLQRFLVERGAPPASILMVTQGRQAVTLVVSHASEEHLRLLQILDEFTAELAGRSTLSVSPDHDLVVCMPRKALVARVRSRPIASSRELWLVPIGELANGEALSLNWRSLGHVLVAGLPGVGVDVVLTTLLTSLATRCTPEQLRLWTIADPDFLPAQIGGLPHQEVVVRANDEHEVEWTLGKIRSELTRRMHEAAVSDREGHTGSRLWPEIVLVIGEAATIATDSATLELLSAQGPRYRIRCLAASTQGAALRHEALDHFSTRLALQLFDDEESIRVLGRPDASDLSTGELLLRVDRRVPLRARGYRVETTELDALIQAMRDDGGVTPITQEAEVTEEPIATPPESDAGSIPFEPIPCADLTPSEMIAETFEMDEPAIDGAEEDGEAPAGTCIHIRCFGDFVVTSGEREVVPSGEEGGSYKAWEVLAFLAAQPTGSVAKDKLLAAVWPDVDSDRAARRLKVAMTRLRALLAQQVPGITAEVVRTDRDGTCRLDTDMAASDVQQFVDLCHASATGSCDEVKLSLERAIDLYQGDLLAGRGTRFYEWVDERDDNGLSLRERYRESFYEVTRRLADLHVEEDRPELATPLFKSILRLEPTLEDIVRQLYLCYGQLQDLRSLIQEDRNLRQALRQVYYDPDDPADDPSYYEPEPETIDLFNQIRATLEARLAVGRPPGK